MIKYITLPNCLTACNAICGILAIFAAITYMDNLQYASYFIFAGAIFDFLDGFAARLLKKASEFGKQLDSLSDAISFGAAPAVLLFQLLNRLPHTSAPQIVYIFPVLFLTTSVLRLARFNTEASTQLHFTGLPTPAAALLFCAIIFEMQSNSSIFHVLNINNHFSIISSLSVIISFLMISNITMFSLKLKGFQFAKNTIAYIFLTLSLILLVFFGLSAIFYIILLYILFSIVLYLIMKIKK